MSAELLKRAAEKLREHVAEAVVAGPWEYRDRRDDPDTFALMHPPVALALAEWFEFAADLRGRPGVGFVGMVDHPVLIARAILREEP